MSDPVMRGSSSYLTAARSVIAGVALLAMTGAATFAQQPASTGGAAPAPPDFATTTQVAANNATLIEGTSNCNGTTSPWTIITPPTHGTTSQQVLPAVGGCSSSVVPYNFLFYTWTDTAAAPLTTDSVTASAPGVGTTTFHFAYRPLALTHDFNGDGKSDILFVNNAFSNPALALWLMNGSMVSSSGIIFIPLGWQIVGQRDFGSGNPGNADGKADLLWRSNTGDVAIWFMNGLTVLSTAVLGNVPTTWSIKGSGELDGYFYRNGVGDLQWHDSSSGTVAFWDMLAGQVSYGTVLATVPTSTWTILGSDNRGDILWQSNMGAYALWHIYNGHEPPANGNASILYVDNTVSYGTVASNWVVQALGDFNGDSYLDILWRDTSSGTVAIWFTDANGNISSAASVAVVAPASGWNVANTGDYNGDGKSDILWVSAAGDLAIWFMNGSTIASTPGLGNIGTSWQVQSLNSE